MTDARLPERWLNDRRLRQLPDDAFRLFVTSLMWSVANKTDGVLTEEDLALIPGRGNRGAIWILTDVGLWIGRHLAAPGSGQDHYWLIADFEATQTTRAELEAAEAARRKARDKKRRQRAASAVPRDVPRDNTRPGQARPGQAPQTVGRGLDFRVRGAEGEAAGGNGRPPTPSQTRKRVHDGPNPVVLDVQNFSDRGTSRGQPADRNAREACPVCGMKQRIRTNGKLARHGPKFTPCRGSGLALTRTAS
jgi:hypothetical protein